MPTPENPSIRRERITVELLIPNDGQCPSFDDSDLDSVFRAVRSGTIATSHEVMESHLIRGEVAFEACERLGVDPAFFGLDVPRNTNLDTQAIEAIHKILSGNEWSADTAPAIARVIEETGLPILTSEDERDDIAAVMHLNFDLTLEQMMRLNDVVQGERQGALNHQETWLSLDESTPEAAARYQADVDIWTSIEVALNEGLTQSFPETP